MEKEAQNLKAKHKSDKVWDCESSLYDSYELKSFQQQLDSAISTRTMSMPHLSSSSSLRREPPPPQPFDHNPASKKHSRLTRSFSKLIRSVFRSRHNRRNTSTKDEMFFVYDTSSVLSTISEVPEMVPDFDLLSPDMKSLVTRTRSDRFRPTSLGISCA
ncbi:hypothetical protein HanXRQr2_Chr02g0071011 [Helianthus annuus]|uniref:Uncharacterized protein n=1 Tax=Helianthus annuus TaxID=4232 RepID=A0A9K3JPM5_HELAN|nr:uncharacterized protein LOC110874612 [Helianthus annuus]KAF5818867.1 hypothetical protein HanXRQr2_Chr02g0071011 [Helianthus annuus]KAJ0605089.1 hypothetical protein HanHA300_Chr02g0059031 [Helianthus annuus]KAJ0619107.1 hypothetical protein HanHA89_Chr02g0067581 [Helianthus annuus]KAJ0777555.1 hypothetical protein HanLR1_Chr02g0061771 [Helianthus annuus]KAJ0786589.1 hypothetical protein HanOQP8_Chr02g0072951 [Helianthus annuus]